jgi:DNA primase
MLEILKQIDLVEFMSRCWQTRFVREGGSFVALSPFRQEAKASFHVNQESDGHWVFFDFGSGAGGSIIDAVMAHDGHSDVGLAIRAAQEMAEEVGLLPKGLDEPGKKYPKPDLEGLFNKLCTNDTQIVRDYLTGRGIASAVVDDLIARRVVLLNRIHESDYCCFAVRNAKGRLHSLFNRKINGPALRERFLLGKQHLFCTDWGKLSQAGSVYICEAIIDAISVLTLQGDVCVLAMPGVYFDRLDCLPPDVRLIEAFDADEAGRAAAERLRRQFPQHAIERFELHGAHDVNDLLRSGKHPEIPASGKLSVKQRLEIALSDKPSRELAAKYGVHHSRICDIRNDAAEVLAEVWAKRSPGRNPNAAPPEEVERLQREMKEMKHHSELQAMRNDWLEFQVKIWQERTIEAARTAKARKKKRR